MTARGTRITMPGAAVGTGTGPGIARRRSSAAAPLRLDVNVLRWKEAPVDVATFARTHTLPAVVKLDSGDYGNFGTGTHVDVQQPFLLYSGRRCNKVLAASVYWDDAKQDYVPVGPRVVIPANYPGWFYFLQEFGQVGRPWHTIQEVCDSGSEAFMTRTNLQAFRFMQGSTAGERLYARAEVQAGEKLTTGDVFSEPVASSTSACCLDWITGHGNKPRIDEHKYLQCIDLSGKDVLLEFTQKGEFCPVGDTNAPTKNDVFKLVDIIKGRKLPLMVKLAHGQPPSTPCSFTGLLRLEEIYSEETMIACSLGTTRPLMMEFPTDSDIQFIVATNVQQLLNSNLLRVAKEYCEQHIQSYIGGIKVVQNFYPDHVQQGSNTTSKNMSSPLPPVPPGEAQSDDGSSDYSIDSEFDDDEDEEDEVKPEARVRFSQGKGNVEEFEDEPFYEVIPGALPHADEEDGYLKPVKRANEKSVTTVILPPQQKPKDPVHENVYMNDDRGYVTVVSTGAQDRLDAFLTDSVQELSRRQEGQQVAQGQQTSHDEPPPQPVLETSEEVDAFLENIFDCRRMTDDHFPVTSRGPRRLASFSGKDESSSAVGGIFDRRSWNGSLRYKIPPLKFAFSNPEATLRRYNLKHIRPSLKTFEFRDGPQFSGGHGVGSPVSLNTFVPVQRQSSKSPGSCADPDETASTSSHYRDFYDTRTMHTDSGIFVSPHTWSDSDSPYRSTSEESWTPPDDLTPLSVAEVAQCLHYIGLKEVHIRRFLDEQIDGKQLGELDEGLLREGFPELNALNRKKVLDFAKGWRPKKL